MGNDYQKIKEAAINNAPCPPHAMLSGLAYYYGIRGIYAALRYGVITEFMADAEEQVMLKQLQIEERYISSFVTKIKETEQARTAYTMAKAQGASAEELLQLACKIIQLSIGDKTIQ